MRLKYNCRHGCNRCFYSEYNLMAHVLFDHQFLMPVCSTGIAEKVYKDNMILIKNFRHSKNILSTYRTQLKKRFLKYMYGRMTNMKDEKQHLIFNQNLENYHNELFTRLIYVEHGKYDNEFVTTVKLLREIEAKGLILG